MSVFAIEATLVDQKGKTEDIDSRKTTTTSYSICGDDNSLRIYVVERVSILPDDGSSSSQGTPQEVIPRYAAVFVPSLLVESELDYHDSESPSRIVEPSDPELFSRNLLSKIIDLCQAQYSNKISVKAVLVVRSKIHAPADIVLLDFGLQYSTTATTLNSITQQLLDAASESQVLSSCPSAVLQVLLISSVKINYQNYQHLNSTSNITDLQQPNNITSSYLPSCPVCLYRIDPLRFLGGRKPRSHHLCSKYCRPPGMAPEDVCSNQRLLLPWPSPSHCAVCKIVATYWGFDSGSTGTRSATTNSNNKELDEFFCYECALQETLWVCMSCGYLGCGRYSNMHAALHYQLTGHPYSLELATLRIWFYLTGEFAHRVDLLECPSSPPRRHPWMRRHPESSLSDAGRDAESASTQGFMSSAAVASTEAYKEEESKTMKDVLHAYTQSGTINAIQATPDEKSPKKATMIGEEYEALLQSALEEQAQHYEGEISRLRATLAAEQVDASSMTIEEKVEIDKLRADIDNLRASIDLVGGHLLTAQAQEAGHRATSQRLLREQHVTQELIDKIREETTREHEDGRRQIEELEQQIADLTANQRMRDQFSRDEELLNAQIFGTTSAKTKKKAGKKGWRMGRK